MKFSKSYLEYGSQFCSVEHLQSAEDEAWIYALTAKKKDGEFNNLKTFSTHTVDKLLEKLEKNQHLFLTITGNQVLIRQTSTTGNDAKIIGSAFPNINMEEFYYQILKNIPANTSFVAVSRKDQVESILNSYKKNSLEVIGFSLGFLTIQNLVPLLQQKEVQLAAYKLELAGDQIIDFQKTGSQEEKLYRLDDTQISSNYMLALAGLFSYGGFPGAISSNFSDLNAELRTNHRQNIFFRKGLTLGIGVLLTALLINFLLFTNYYQEHQNLTEKYQAELLMKEVYKEKQQQIANKENQVANILKNSNSRSTFYLNRIIVSQPGSILLTGFTYQPLEKKIKEREAVTLTQNTITINGETTDEAEFSRWIKNLESIIWITELKVADFSYKNMSNSEFSIIVTIDQDEASN